MKKNKPVTKKAYADHRGVDPSIVTRWAKAGRIATTAEGLVLVEESDRMLDDSLDPSRGGPGGSPAGRNGAGKPEPKTLAEAAREEKIARTKLINIEIAEKQGVLVTADSVAAAASRLAVEIKTELGAIADRLSEQLAAETAPLKVRSALMAEFRLIEKKLNRTNG